MPQGRRVPKSYCGEKGVEERCRRRARGFPRGGVKVRCTTGPQVDSNETHSRWRRFSLSGRHAQANPVLLEPIMAVEVGPPREMGDVIGDLSRAAP